MPLPNLIVIGAQKCGTTSLHHYLDLHPEIAMAQSHDSNELDFFSVEGRWRRGVAWYGRQFRDAPVRGDVSPSYSAFPVVRSVPERIAEVLSDVRFVYLVRDPIDRIASEWHQARTTRAEVRPFDEALGSSEDNGYLARSRYATQLQRYLVHFPQERFLVVDQHDLRHDRPDTLREIFRFAGVDESFTSPGFDEALNVTIDARPLTSVGRQVMLTLHRTLGHRLTHGFAGRVPRRIPGLQRSRPEQRPPVGAELRERLAEVLAPEVARLRELTGQTFPSWSL